MDEFATVGLERDPFADAELQHRDMRASLPHEAQPLDDAMVQVDDLGLAQPVDVDSHYLESVNAADLLGVQASAGTLEPGKRADLIAVDGDPLRDVTLLKRIDFVMRSGTIHESP